MTTTARRTPASATRQTRRLLPVVRDLQLDAIASATLNGERVRARLSDAIVSVGRNLTIEAANELTLRIHDPERELLRADFLGRPMDLRIPGEGRWRLDRTRHIGGMTIDDQIMELRFWCIGSAALQSVTSSLALSSRKVDVAGFGKYLAREVKDVVPLRLVVPHPGDVPQLEDTRTGSSKATTKASGFKAGVRLRGKVDDAGRSSYLTRAQLEIAGRILRVCDKERASRGPRLIALMCAMVETELRNPKTPSADKKNSFGTYQPRVGVSLGPDGRSRVTREQALDVELMTKQLLRGPSWTSWTHDGRLIRGAIEAVRLYPTWTLGAICQKIEGSAYPDRYDKQRKHAELILDAWQGGSGGDDGSMSAAPPAQWRRGTADGRESSWRALDREVSRMGRRRFIALPWLEVPRLVIAADQQLIAAQPHLTVSGLDDNLLTEPPTIESSGARSQETVDLSVVLSGWSAPPGASVVLADSGPADGPWVVRTLDAPPGSEVGSVVLGQPTTKVEPAQKRSTAGGGNRSSNRGRGSGTVADKLYAICQTISRKRMPYVYGGGHGSWSAAKSARGLDCSSSTSLALYLAGLMDSGGPQASGWFLSWGQKGRGPGYTVWVKPGSGPDGHVWIEFHGAGRDGHRFDTGQIDGGERGPRLRTSRRSTAGFVPRHA